MKHFAAFFLSFCLVFTFAFSALTDEAPFTKADAAETFEQGSKTVRGNIKVVDLRGTWREMGRQYGALMRKELAEVNEFIDLIIAYNIGNAQKTDSIVATQTAQTPYRVAQFFEGAAETSGLTIEQL